MTNFERNSLDFLIEKFGDQFTREQLEAIAGGLAMTKAMTTYQSANVLQEALKKFPEKEDTEDFEWDIQTKDEK